MPKVRQLGGHRAALALFPPALMAFHSPIRNEALMLIIAIFFLT